MTYLQKLLVADAAFVPPAHVLEHLSAEEARARPTGAPHSLYEELWHVNFWQHLILAVVHADDQSEPVAYPEHAAEGWPNDNDALTEAAWQDLLSRFSSDLQRAAETAGSDLERVARDKTVREHLESIVGHNAYHLGRMVMLRQMSGLWPPPSGGDTW